MPIVCGKEDPPRRPAEEVPNGASKSSLGRVQVPSSLPKDVQQPYPELQGLVNSQKENPAEKSTQNKKVHLNKFF